MEIPKQFKHVLVLVAEDSGDHMILFTKDKISVSKIESLKKKYFKQIWGKDDPDLEIEDIFGGWDTADELSLLLTEAKITHEVIDADRGNWYHGIG
jgi:hypothetical protein